MTSSFPSSPDDETCGYVRDFARRLAVEFNVMVLAPPDRRAGGWPSDVFKLTRSRSLLPLIRDPFQSGDDLNDLIRKNLLTRLAALVSLVCFFAHAVALSFRADVICSNWMVPSGLVGALISHASGKRHVVVEHSGALHLLTRMRGGRLLARFVVAGSDRVMTVSADLKRKLVDLYPHAASRVEVMPMGITIPLGRDQIGVEPSLLSGVHPTVLFIGRLTEIKGLDVLLRAMERLDGLKLIVAGDGEGRDEYQRLARELSLNASFVGRINAVEREKLLLACDAVVIPSTVLEDGRYEGTPVVCLEAMAAGRVVIASRVGGLSEVISDGENGLLFEQGDHQLLREKLMLALNDDILRQRISENARHTAACYDWKRIGFRFTEALGARQQNDSTGDTRIESNRIHG